MATNKKDSIKEPSVVIKPLGSMGGLDNIHLALVVLVVILIALLIAVAYTKPVPVPIFTNATSNLTCSYGAESGNCITPMNSQAAIKQDAESFLASYNNVNSSLSILPYISNVSRMNLSYSVLTHDWYVTFPFQSPSSNTTTQFGMVINDRNTSQITPLIQLAKPTTLTTDYVVSTGVVQIAGQSTCSVQSPLQIYWFVDPYAPGGISSLVNMTNLQSQFGTKVSTSVKILYTQYSENIGSVYGLNNSLALGSYLFCASNQTGFGSFLERVSQTYNGGYMPSSVLAGLANSSGISSSEMSGCLSSAGTFINRQALLAKYYNITSNPAVVTDCRYLSIPQTELDAIRYANSSIT